MKAKIKILLVDDEQISLEFFFVMLSKLGFEVEKAEDGEEALEKIKRFRPGLVILDNIMPKLSGWEVTKIVKESEEFSEVRNTPIIMFSAMDDVKDKLEGFELGIEDYITKPFNFSEVLARIKAVLRHKEFADQLVERERRLALHDEFVKSLKERIPALREASRAAEEAGAVEALLIDLEKAEAGLKINEVSAEELEAKYRMNFEAMKERHENHRGNHG
ncbi:MAG: response regulator [Spirochaetales bacterium]|jgi:DNA-binding response OmpR family regulator|nr:response regulator [Spirochaetales bacterium]